MFKFPGGKPYPVNPNPNKTNFCFVYFFELSYDWSMTKKWPLLQYAGGREGAVSDLWRRSSFRCPRSTQLNKMSTIEIQ